MFFAACVLNIMAHAGSARELFGPHPRLKVEPERPERRSRLSARASGFEEVSWEPVMKIQNPSWVPGSVHCERLQLSG